MKLPIEMARINNERSPTAGRVAGYQEHVENPCGVGGSEFGVWELRSAMKNRDAQKLMAEARSFRIYFGNLILNIFPKITC